MRARPYVKQWTNDEIIDAAHRLDWDDHDIALLLATLEEMEDD